MRPGLDEKFRLISLDVTAVILLVLCVTSAAQARLWDTKPEIESRYGPAIQTLSAARNEQAFLYRYKKFFVIVDYVGGRSQMEFYFPQDFKTRMSPKDIQFFLQANSFGKRWRQSISDMWELPRSGPQNDKLLAVHYDKFPGVAKFGMKLTTPGLVVGSAALLARDLTG